VRQGERGVAPGARASKSSHTRAFAQAAEPPPELELPPELLEVPPELELELELAPELDPELVELPPELVELDPELLELEPELELELAPELELELERPPELLDPPELELLPALRPSLDPSPETLGAHATAPVAIARRSTRRVGRGRGRSIIAVAPPDGPAAPARRSSDPSRC
jgi:hypothetical protein